MLKRPELLLTTLLVTLTAGTSLHAASVGFKPVQNYTVGTNPNAAAGGDFNHDGKMDLAVVNFGDPTVGDNGSVSILFGKGDGTFQAPKNLTTGKNCSGIVVGDFNGDGFDDMALVRPGDPTANDNGDVTIFLGNGDGTFRQGDVLTPGKNPSGSIVAIDLNADRRLDLIVVNRGDNSVSVLLGNGDGTFQLPVAYATARLPYRVQVVDLAGTGETDLAVGREFGLDFFLGNGDGTFRQGPSVCCFFDVGFQAARDFNNDRRVDLLLEECSIFHVCSENLLLGNGDGTFQQKIVLPQYVVAAADYNGDGNLDGVGGVLQVPQVQVLQGNGDGTFLQPVSFAVGGSETPGILLAEDINNDNAPDIVTFNFSSTSIRNSISVLVNIGTDFTIAASKPSPSTLTAGQSATSTISLNLLSAFNNPVSLACSLQRAKAGAPTCSLSSNSVTFDGSGKAMATLTINAGSGVAARNSFQSSINHGLLWLPVAAFVFLGTGFGVGLSKKRRMLAIPISAVFLSGLIAQVACGGGGGPKSTAYTVTVTGSSGATQHSATVNLTVQ